MSNARTSLRALSLLAPIALAAGCASGPYPATLLLQGEPSLNQTFDGKSSAVSIRIVPLVDRAAFEGAKDEDLLASPEPGLPRGTWIPPHVDTDVYVGQKSTVTIEIKPEVRFLGVIALFNEQQGEHRRVLPVGEIDDQKLVFADYAFTIQPRAEGDGEAP